MRRCAIVGPDDGARGPGRRPADGGSTGDCCDARGHAGWWPGETPFEVCLGAILTQNTSWTNVEKALGGPARERDCCPTKRCGRCRPARLAPADPLVGLLQRQGPPRAGVPGLPRPRVRRPRGGHGRRRPGGPAREAPGRDRHRPRDRGLDRALRRGPAALRRGRLHAPGLRAAGAAARATSPTTRCSASSWTGCRPTRRSTTTTTRRSCCSAKDVCRTVPTVWTRVCSERICRKRGLV